LTRAIEPGPSVAEIKRAILGKLTLTIGKDVADATPHDWYMATALALRDTIVDRWRTSERDSLARARKQVYYLSLEFLIGRLLTDALGNLGMLVPFQDALRELGRDFETLRDCEPDPGLGNGGLGRLAACFMESLSTLQIPAIGYGIRYEFGLFRQVFADGWQQEIPDDWLALPNPWEFARPELTCVVGFGGHVENPRRGGPR